MTDSFRKQAEDAYKAEGLDTLHPIGSREWTLFFIGFMSGKVSGIELARQRLSSGSFLRPAKPQ